MQGLHGWADPRRLAMRIYRRILRQIPLFEWDADKRESNLLKHGIDLVDAAEIFQRPVAEWEDGRHEYGERRVVAIGELDEVLLTVVYTVRGDVYRLISARRARRDRGAGVERAWREPHGVSGSWRRLGPPGSGGRSGQAAGASGSFLEHRAPPGVQRWSVRVQPQLTACRCRR